MSKLGNGRTFVKESNPILAIKLKHLLICRLTRDKT
jgi:hypothetical protein